MRTALALALGGVAGVLAATQPLADTDMWWHIATGRETLAHGIVRADVFSWTVRGAPVSTDQWLGQIGMYLAYLAGGWYAVAVLRVALVVALVALVAASAGRAAARPLAIVLATMPALLLTRAVWVDRPELAGFVLFAALLLLLRRGRDGSWAALGGCVAVVGVWANVHGSFALGAVLVACVCAEGAVRDAARRREYVTTALATLAITLATPAGPGAWTAPGSHLLAPPRAIQEWAAIDVRTPLGVAYVATLAIVIACAFTGPRIPSRELAILVPVALLSLTAARQAPLLAIAAAPLLAGRAGSLLPVAPPRSVERARSGARALALAPAAALFVLALVLAPRGVDERAYPRAALGSIPSGDGTLARYEWGGWLIWAGTPVFVDGRLTPYAGVLEDYHRIIGAAPGWQDAIRSRGVRTLLVAPADPVAARAIELGWSVRARSDVFVLIAVP